MKQIKITTSKGEFLVVDGKINLETWDYPQPLKFISKLSEITELEASEIADEVWGKYKNYTEDSKVGNYKRLIYSTAIESLHSLLKSKGIHLFRNPNNSDYFTNRSTEQKTFYNPYIFKL